MAEDVYAAPDLTKKVGYRRERERETEDRGEREERVVDIYVSADDLGRGPDPDPDPDPGTQQNAAQAQHGASDEPRKKNAFKAATVCLGLLCVILLAVITGLGIRNSERIEEINNLTNLTKDLDRLQSKYDNLTKDLEQTTKQKDELQSRFNNITELKRRLCELSGWQIFGRGCYYISTEQKNWEESRQWCRDRQSDLIIINSKEEQDFVNSVNKTVWLGLTDREVEGQWKWVDGTPLASTPTNWIHGEPNDNRGDEDCAEHHSSLYGWYDDPCTRHKHWMCEKVL